jgi:hypothetical protein
VLAERWTPELELAAATLETLHALLRVTLAVHAKGGAELLAPLEVPRPSSRPASAEAPAPLSPLAGALALRKAAAGG